MISKMKNRVPQRKPHKHMSGEEMLKKLTGGNQLPTNNIFYVKNKKKHSKAK